MAGRRETEVLEPALPGSAGPLTGPGAGIAGVGGRSRVWALWGRCGSPPKKKTGTRTHTHAEFVLEGLTQWTPAGEHPRTILQALGARALPMAPPLPAGSALSWVTTHLPLAWGGHTSVERDQPRVLPFILKPPNLFPGPCARAVPWTPPTSMIPDLITPSYRFSGQAGWPRPPRLCPR